MEQGPRKLIAFLFIVITITYLDQWSSITLGNTYTNWFLASATLISLFSARKYFYTSDNKYNFTFVNWLLLWNVICIVRGIFDASNYWEYKNLVAASFVLLMPLGAKAFTNKELVQYITRQWIRFALPLFFLFVWVFDRGDAFGQYLAPIAIICLFLFLLRPKWQLVVVVFTLIAILSDLNARSATVKFSVAIVLSSIYLFRSLIHIRLLILARLLLLVLPIVLLGLGISGTLNIFQFGDYIKGGFNVETLEEGKREQADLTADTRTFLYSEVIRSAVNNEYYFFGRTPARGNDSESFGDESFYDLKMGRHERFANEVSILNIFTWTGLLGVFLTFLVFAKASFLAIHQSNNLMMRIVGLYVAFRWVFAWVEDFSDFNITNLYLWISIAMCLSNSFRAMSDYDIREWARGIFNKPPVDSPHPVKIISKVTAV